MSVPPTDAEYQAMIEADQRTVCEMARKRLARLRGIRKSGKLGNWDPDDLDKQIREVEKILGDGNSDAAAVPEPVEYPERDPDPYAIQRLEEVVDQYLTMRDRHLVRLLCGTVIAHGFNRPDPVWLVIVEPPSHGKTTLLDCVVALAEAYYVEELTPSAFQSGYKDNAGDEVKGLLENADGKILVVPEFSSLLDLNYPAQRKVFGKMRSVYDGKARISAGSGVDQPWHGRLGFIAGATGAFDYCGVIRQRMGERFLVYRPLRPSAEAMKRKIQTNLSLRLLQTNAGLVDAFRTWRDGIGRVPEFSTLTWEPGVTDCIADLAEIIATSRTWVPKNRQTKEVVDDPDPEGPGRLMKQMTSLAAGVAVACGRRTVTEEDLESVRQIAFSNVPTQKRKLMSLLLHQEGDTLAALASAMGVAENTVRSHLVDLMALGVVDRSNMRLTPRWRGLLRGVRILDERSDRPMTSRLQEIFFNKRVVEKSMRTGSGLALPNLSCGSVVWNSQTRRPLSHTCQMDLTFSARTSAAIRTASCSSSRLGRASGHFWSGSKRSFAVT